jgi:VCBS repeat-containing protein
LVSSLLEDGSVVLDLLASAHDADGDVLTAAVVSGPVHGTLTRNVDGTYRYVAAANYSGEDSFSYVASDGRASSQTAIVRLVITAVADAPTLSFSDNSNNSSRELFRTGWESVANFDTTSTLLEQNTLDGWSLITQPDPNCGGDNGFEIWSSNDRMADNNGVLRTVQAATGNGKNWLELNSAAGSQSQTMGITRHVNTVAGANYVLSFDYAGRVGYSTDFTRIGIYVDGVKIASYANTSPTSGLNWQALQFSFIGKGGTQSIRIVSEATRQDPNGRGAMIDDIALLETLPANTGLEDTAIRLSTITAGLTDADGSEQLMLAIESIPVGAVLSDGIRSFTATAELSRADISGWALTNLSLTPPANFNGLLTLRVVATAIEQSNANSLSTSALLTVTVRPVNDAPVVNNDSATVRANQTVRIDVLANDSDLDGDSLSTQLVSGPAHGKVVRNADGSFSYTALYGYQGNDSFTYRINDSDLNSALATVNIVVTAPNRAPVAKNDTASTLEDTAVRLNLVANDTDADGDALIVKIVSAPCHGTLTLNADGSYTYTPDRNWYGTEVFTYRATDGMGDSSIATVTITVAKVNDAPMALNAIYQLQQDGSVRIDFSDLVADVDGDALNLSLTNASHGTLSRNWDGSYTYRPARGYAGLDSFTYTVNDGKVSSTGKITLNIMGTASGCYGSSASLTVQSRLLLGIDNGHLVYGSGDNVESVADLSGNAEGLAVSWTAGQATVLGNQPYSSSGVDEKWLKELLITAEQIDLAAQTGLVVKVQRT